MWILQATVATAPEPRTFVLPAGTFIVGRKDEPTTQILILNDKAISREHARIVIDPLPDAADSSAKADATFIGAYQSNNSPIIIAFHSNHALQSTVETSLSLSPG